MVLSELIDWFMLIDWLNVLELKASSQLQCSLWKEDGAEGVDWLIYAN